MPKLTEVERKIWVAFHEFAYKDDFALAEKIIREHPRWAIICSYYAMHDIAKLYLGKVHNIKISGLEVHRQTIDELKRVLEQEEEKEKVIKLLEDAENEIKDIDAGSIPYLLITGKKERGKAQYYSEQSSSKNMDYSQKALWFIANIAEPFIKIMEGIIGAG